jgi:hypothetical protein
MSTCYINHRGAAVKTLKDSNSPPGSSQTITLPLASTSRTNFLRVEMDCEWCHILCYMRNVPLPILTQPIQHTLPHDDPINIVSSSLGCSAILPRAH